MSAEMTGTTRLNVVDYSFALYFEAVFCRWLGETPESPGYVKLSNENFVLEVTNPAIFWREKNVLEWNPIN